MDPPSPTSRNPKYAWSEISRAEPSKRAAGERVGDFDAVFSLFDEATASEQASRCIQCPNPTCVEACPLNSPIGELLRLTADGQFMEAARLMFASNSMPELFAHVCAGERLCEAACILGAKSDPVPIPSIARFLLDYGWKHGLAEPPVSPPTGQSVAVVGAGLCGLVNADELSRSGYAVTVFDSYAKPGGRLVNGLPGFRVDRKLIEKRVELLRQRGVQFRMGMVCGRDITLGALRRDFDAVFFGLGRTDPIRLEIPGVDLAGVHQAYPFVLQNTADASLDAPRVEVRGRRVIVLGGGETALDTLRIALRCGAREAVCIYRRDAADMPARPNDYGNAVEEGARFLFRSQAVAIIGNEAGAVTQVRCERTAPGAPDASGRPAVTPVAGSEFDVPADVVLMACGFAPPTLSPGDEFADDAHVERRLDAVQRTQEAPAPDRVTNAETGQGI